MGKDYVMLLDEIVKDRSKEERSNKFREGYHSTREFLNKGKKSESEEERKAFPRYVKNSNFAQALNYVHRSLHDAKLKHDSYEQGHALKIAHDLMHEGIKTGRLDVSFLAAQLYDKLGLGDKESVKRRLLEAVKKCNPSSYNKEISSVRQFIASHTAQGNLEQKIRTSPVAIATGFVLLVSFLSSQTGMTGFAVQQSASSFSSGWTSIFFFAFIVMAVFYLFHKK